MKKLILSLAIITPLLFTSCKKSAFCVKADDNIITENRDINTFDKIELKGSSNIHYKQSDVTSLYITTSKKIMPYLVTKVNGDVLEINTKNNTCLKGDYTVDIYVEGPNLSALKISGSGDIIALNKVNTQSLDLKISGSGDIRFDSLKTTFLNSKISGSGDIELVGLDTVLTQDVKISGSGNFNAANQLVKTSNISISGSGNCKVNAFDKLNVKISGSGDVTYYGLPLINVDITGSGSLNHF